MLRLQQKQRVIALYLCSFFLVSCGGPENAETDEETQNNRPSAVFTYQVSGTRLVLDASSSTDPDNDSLTYTWMLPNSEQREGVTTQVSFATQGRYTIALQVADAALQDDFSLMFEVDESLVPRLVGSVQEPVNPEQSSTFNAAGFFASNCAVCHGANGEGSAAIGSASTLQGKSLSRSELSATVSRMPSASNPACEGIDNCVASLTDYLLDTFISEETTVDIAASCQSQNALLQPKLRRLTSRQFQNTAETVFAMDLSDISWPDFGDGVPTLGMSNDADTLNVNAINFENTYHSVSTLADKVLAEHSEFSACANSSSSSCVETLLDEFAPLLWRRPLSTVEQAQLNTSLNNLRGDNVNNRQQLQWAIASLVLSSHFMFRHELGALSSGIRQLNAYEVANLLAYALWDSPPDSTLYRLAANASIRDEEVLQQQVLRMIRDPRFQEVLTNFYVDFLKLERVLTVDKIAELNFSADIRSALLASSKAMLADGVGDLNQNITAPLGNRNFYLNSQIAPLFAQNADAYSTALQAANLPASERNGILTHPAFLAVHAKEGASGIVKRGVFTLKQMLCIDFGDPPDDLSETELPPDIDPETTSTRMLLHLRHSSQPICSNCHQQLDPAGFGYENFDEIGRFRLTEKGEVPIDAAGELLIRAGGSTIQFENSIDYTQALLDTPEIQACLTRRFAEFMTGQGLDENSCELSKLLHYSEVQGRSIENIILGIMQLESIRVRQ